MPAKRFDLIVIGTGAGGSTAAGKCARAGWKVAQIDANPFGGTCALRGCDPKKVLVGAAELIDWNKRMSGKGIEADSRIIWRELMEHKNTFTERVPEYREKGMKKQGISSFLGRGRFEDEQTLRVGEELLSAEHILIAAGARPAVLPIAGFQHLVTSTEFLALKNLPETIVFVGGGYISFEFAFLSKIAGAEVHIVHRGERPLEGFDADMVTILLEKASDLCINTHLNAEVKSVKKNEQGFSVELIQNFEPITISGNLVVHGAGRVPDIEDMALEKGRIKRDKKGIVVNEYLQSTTNPHVYAAGDSASTGGKPLTPVAGFESNIVASNLLEGNHRKAVYPAQPTVAFTIPPLAAVGLTEQEARDLGIDISVNFQRSDSWYTNKRTNEAHTASKTIIDKERNQIIGAHILGSKAEEIINLFAMAMNHKVSPGDLKKMVYAYPSHASDIPYML